MKDPLNQYYEFVVSAPDDSREAIMFKLRELGSLGTCERAGNTVAYFGSQSDISLLCDQLEAFRNVLESSGLDPAFSYDYRLLPGKDWNEEWKKSFKPINLGKNLTVVPSWLKPPVQRIPIIIDPAMAFGTGYHETTRRCLVLIEKLSNGSRAKSFLDFGTGTGILAIGAVRLGFSQVTAIDIDQQAVEAALHNAGLNKLNSIAIKKGSIADVDGTFDVITANLLSDILIENAGNITARLNPGGTAILSGMIDGQEDNVIQAMEDSGLTHSEKAMDGQWVTVILRNSFN